MTGFFERIQQRVDTLDTTLMLGIDPHEATSAEEAYRWSKALLTSIGPHVVGVKPNIAFFERFPGGLDALATLVAETDLPVLLDAKRGDIGSTAEAYASAAYDRIGADAVTLHATLGRESVAPFLRPGKGVFVLARTSNPGAGVLQELPTPMGPFYRALAAEALTWGPDIGLVVGATVPPAVSALRSAHPDAWLLTPGVGAQGGDIRPDTRTLVPVSRGISAADDPLAAALVLAARLRPVPRPLPPRPLLDALITADCIRTGAFTLRSGATSTVYVDCRTLVGHPRLLSAIAVAIGQRLPDCDRIVGVPTAGLPLGTALSILRGLPLLYTRTATKGHGTGKRVEGPYACDDRAVLIDDVATSGTSLLEALTPLRDVGIVVEHAFVIVDRQEGARQALAARGVQLHALFTLDDLLAHAR